MMAKDRYGPATNKDYYSSKLALEVSEGYGVLEIATRDMETADTMQ